MGISPVVSATIRRNTLGSVAEPLTEEQRSGAFLPHAHCYRRNPGSGTRFHGLAARSIRSGTAHDAASVGLSGIFASLSGVRASARNRRRN